VSGNEKGISHTHTSYNAGIYVNLNVVNSVFAEISSEDNWLKLQSNQLRAIFFVTSRLVMGLYWHSIRVKIVLFVTSKLVSRLE